MSERCSVPHRIDEMEFAGCAACAWREYHKLIEVLAAIDHWYEDTPYKVKQILDQAADDYQAFRASREYP